MTRNCIICAIIAITAGCGDGSSTAGSGGEPAVADPQTTVLGSRELPGGTVTVTTPYASGRAAVSTVTIAFTGDAAPTSAELLVGTDYETAVPATLTATTDGWTATVAAPDPGAALLVRLVHADGSITESAVGDFRMP